MSRRPRRRLIPSPIGPGSFIQFLAEPKLRSRAHLRGGPVSDLRPPESNPHSRRPHIPLMTYVTCPIRRYHPAVVAQKAATMQLLSDGRFTLGLGAGENLNEHITGGHWPMAGVRHEMLEEAVKIIRALWAGGSVTHRGKHFDVKSAKVWDLPDAP